MSRNITWNKTLDDAFCEGKEIPYLVDGVYEVFSMTSGGFLILIGIAGVLQPRIELLLRFMYAGIIMSGVGTVLLHYKRLNIFNFADLYPLIITLSFGIVAITDELIFEIGRERGSTGNLVVLPNGVTRHEISAIRTILYTIWYSIATLYMIVGLTLTIFADQLFTYDIVGIYFGVPFAVCAIGGMKYLSYFRPYKQIDAQKKLDKVRNVATILGLFAIVFKVIDSFGCTSQTVWIMPHSFFHILVTYAAHCFIVFLAYYRANNILLEGEMAPDIQWRYAFPTIFVPNINRRDSKHIVDGVAFGGTASEVVPQSPAQAKTTSTTTTTTTKKPSATGAKDADGSVSPKKALSFDALEDNDAGSRTRDYATTSVSVMNSP